MSDRIAFEKWFGAPAHGLDRLGDGYRLSSAHSAWGAWQAGVAAERERHRLEVHSCGPTCTMAGCVNARLRADFARECSDTDELLRMICIDPQDVRTDGGSLNLAKVRQGMRHNVRHERTTAARAKE